MSAKQATKLIITLTPEPARATSFGTHIINILIEMKLKRKFFDRNTILVARELLGKWVILY